MGDFTLPHRDCQAVTGVDTESQRMVEFLDDNFLHQSVSQRTREKNILDLVIVSQDHLIHNVAVGKHFDSCDH